MTTPQVPWREAWSQALYGERGFFRASRPAAHFRTSAHLPVFASAIAELALRADSAAVVDVGAGGGELLSALVPLVGDQVQLVAVEIAPRPTGLDPAITWRHDLPDHVDGLLIANEWLDNIPCDIVEADDDGVVRLVLVDPATGAETLGGPYDDPAGLQWLRDWWPLEQPGERAEVGTTRDAAWAEAVSRVEEDGVAVAIDYGHALLPSTSGAPGRPPFGTLRSYEGGREVAVRPDGSRDVTAHVAVDATAAATGARLLRQRDALAALGVTGARPPIELAHTDPVAYLHALGRAGESGDLLARGGLGDFWWVVDDGSRHGTLLP